MTVTTRLSTQGTDSTSFVITLPDGSNVSGRRVIVVASNEGTGSTTWPTSPAFTEFVAGNGTATHIAIAYRNINGTEGFSGTDDTITVTGASVQWNAHAYLLTSDEFDSATAPEGAATAIGTNNGTTNPPSLTPSWGSANNLWIAASALRFAGNWTAAPTNYTNLLSSNGGDANAPLGTARRVLTATSEDPATFSHDGGNTAWVATTIAIRPSAGGAAVALDGDLETVVETDGDLSVAKLVEGDTELVVELDGDLSATKPLTSTDMHIVVELDGELTVTPGGGGTAVALDGTAGVVVELAGELSVTRGLDGQVELVVDLDGELSIPVVQQLDGVVAVVVGVGPLAELFVQRPQGVAPRRLWRTSRVY